MKKFVFIFLILLLAGCKTTEVIETLRVENDTVWVYNLEKDSVYLLDSVYIHEYTKGDTVFVNRDRLKIRYRDRGRIDSIFIHRTDTVMKVVKEKVEKKLSWWQQLKMHLGGICFWLIIIAMALFILKRWYK